MWKADLLDGLTMHHSDELVVLLQQLRVRHQPCFLLTRPEGPIITHFCLQPQRFVPCLVLDEVC